MVDGDHAAVMHTRCWVESNKRGCLFIGMVSVAAVLLFAGWVIGEFALAPMHCGSPVCERWVIHLHLALVTSAVGFGCLVLAGLQIRTAHLLPLGAAILGLTAFTGLFNPGMFVLTAADFLVVAFVAGGSIFGWLDV
jgi:hypothetical protein